LLSFVNSLCSLVFYICILFKKLVQFFWPLFRIKSNNILIEIIFSQLSLEIWIKNFFKNVINFYLWFLVWAQNKPLWILITFMIWQNLNFKFSRVLFRTINIYFFPFKSNSVVTTFFGNSATGHFSGKYFSRFTHFSIL
jgi:hypothetical protein